MTMTVTRASVSVTPSAGRRWIAAAYALTTLCAFLYLNLYGLLDFYRWNKWAPTVSAIGWPRTIAGLSPDPVTIPVPDFNLLALLLDALLAMIVSTLSAMALLRAMRALPRLQRFSLRGLFMATTFLAMLLFVLTGEWGYNGWQLLFEIARLWTFLAMATACCVFTNWTPR